MKKTSIVILCMLLTGLAGRSWAEAGVSGAQILQQQNGARVAALGGAFAAISGDLIAINVNPAGAYDLSRMEIMLMHVAGFEGQNTEYLVGAIPLPDLGVMGAQFLYRSMPVIDNHVPGESTVTVKDLIYGLSFARPLLAGFSMGLNAKFVSLQLGPVDTSVISFDMGTQYSLNNQLSFGLALRNVGTPVMFKSVEDPLPMTFIAGSSLVPYDEGAHKLITALDIQYLVPDKNTSVHLGGEYWFKRLLALRLGYMYSVQKSVRGLSLGVGFRFKAGNKVDLVLDYTLQPQFWEAEDFETENIFTLSVKF